MSLMNIIRAWKDEEYRLSLSEAERALLPANPAGVVEVSAEDLDQVAGGAECSCCCSCGCSCGCCRVAVLR
jgi:mersacidin/lichenicidin family type 2 lantibiotic